MKKAILLFFCSSVFINRALALPNLVTTTPSGWSAPLVASVTQDAISEDTLYTNANYYYSWAITNNGDQAVSNAFNIQILHGDSVIKSYRPASLNVGTVLKVNYLQHKITTPGNYTMRLVIDSLNEVSESNESDNQYSRSFYWAPGAPQDIDVNPGLLYYVYQVPEPKYTKCSWIPGQVIVDIDVPQFNIEEASKGEYRVKIDGFENLSNPGKPALPFKFLTLAIPPDAAVQSVEVQGNYSILAGTYNIEPAAPSMPLNGNPGYVSKAYEQYDKNKQETYSSGAGYPSSHGELISTGGLRKYNLVNVAVYPVSYSPVKGELQYASHLQVIINYTKDAEKEIEYTDMASDNVADLEASELIYNFSQAKEWYPYKPRDKGKATYDYVIITTAALVPACSTIAKWKTAVGYKVNIITKEWIDGAYTGVDIQQKIRNFLRANYVSWGTVWVLIVGNNTDIPMRNCCIKSNNPGSDPDLLPVPTDLYYADLTSADNVSWNKDGDSYWGEALTSSGNTGGNDSPDYVQEVFVGRIPWSDADKIQHIGSKIVMFERNTDASYKKKALCAAGILYFDNEDHHTYQDFIDGADEMEYMMNYGILTRATTTTLYEKEGLQQSPYTCTDKITEANIVKYCQGVGIFAEFNHGFYWTFVRKVWSTDNGDNVPDSTEITWPMGLSILDAPSLDDNKPATMWLNSCLNGHPETENNLGAALINEGGIAVCAATRVSYVGSEYMMRKFFGNLLKDTTFSHGYVGKAFDQARRNYASYTGMGGISSWTNVIGFNLYGDPSLLQLGYDSTACMNANIWICNRGGHPTDLSVSNITYSEPWIIEVLPTTMTVAPGESSGISVTIQPAGLPEGYYYDTLLITSNDPDETVYREPITLRVIIGGVSEIIPSQSPYLKIDAYPNPFGKEITIKCSLPINKVSLGIYDVSGRLVKSFSNIKTTASSVTWDASNCPAGIYFVRLKAGEVKTSGKIILMK